MNWAKNFPIPGYHVALLIIGLGLHFWPSTELSFATGNIPTVVGLLCVISALAISLWSALAFGEDASVRPSNLRTVGPYRISRNPMYLSWSLLIFGLGFIVGSWWLFGASLLATVVTHYRVIAAEERFLVERFGDDYENYRREVPRWLWLL